MRTRGLQFKNMEHVFLYLTESNFNSIGVMQFAMYATKKKTRSGKMKKGVSKWQNIIKIQQLYWNGGY